MPKPIDKELQKELNKMLLNAAWYHKHDIMKKAVELGADVNAQPESKKTALMEVCDSGGSFEMAKYLIDHGADITLREKYGESALSLACAYGHLDTVKLLLDLGAEVNIRGSYGRTPLHHASTIYDDSGNHYDIVKLLLERGADPNAVHDGGDTPLLETVWSENVDMNIIKILIEYGTNLEHKGPYGGTALSRAAEKGNMELVNLIKEHLGDSEEKIEVMEKALLGAMKENKKEMVDHLLEQGKGRYKKKTYRIDVLAYACRQGYTDIIEYVFDQGFDPSKDDMYYSLGDACYYGQLEAVKLFIEHGADVNGGGYGASDNPIMKAAVKGYIDMAQYLLDKGANIEAPDYRGNTPLCIAAWNGRTEMVKFLIEKGANIHAKNNLNWNALMQACVEGHFEIAKLLVEKGSDIKLVEEEKGVTPLILAAWQGSYEIAKLLLDKGADKNIKDKEGKTAYDHAKERYHSKVAELLEADD